MTFRQLVKAGLRRKIIAFFLIAVTANPVTWSYVPWILEVGLEENMPLKLLMGAFLLWGHLSYLRATFRSLGVIGIGFGAAMCGLAVWHLVDKEWIDITNPDTMSWCSIVAGSLIYGFGMVWSIVRRSSSGQLDPTEAS